MPRRSERRPPVPVGDTTDPRGLGALGEAFLRTLEERHFSWRTLKNRRYDLAHFIAWLADRDITRPVDVTREILDRYHTHVFHEVRVRDQKPRSPEAQVARIVVVKTFFSWLTRRDYLLANPASELELPKVPQRLPRNVLTVDEAEKVLAQPDVTDTLGIRNRAILEVLYSTGMRRGELIALKLTDIDQVRGTLLVREGKGKKDRMIPIGERALSWVQKYTDESRPSLAAATRSSAGDDDDTLFLSSWGGPLGDNTVTMMVRGYVNQAGVKKGACHLFRHTMATQMLEHGADVRFIQAMLGHAQLTTTQIYTKVAILKLKQVHSQTHPAEIGRGIVDGK